MSSRLQAFVTPNRTLQVFEDDEYVYIVMEYCKGGELFHEVGELRYTEDMVKGSLLLSPARNPCGHGRRNTLFRPP